MRVLFFIDSLASGGAQRQLVELALGLRSRHDEVCVVYYEKHSFFNEELERAGVRVIETIQHSKFENIRNFRRLLYKIKPDIVQAYLHGPGVIAELASFFNKKWKLVTTERSIYNLKFQKKFTFIVGRQLHRLSDWIVVNSYSNMEFLKNSAPYLKKKVSVIINSVDLDRFHPSDQRSQSNRDELFEFIHIGSMSSIKNAPAIVRALALLREKTDRDFRLCWIGRADRNSPDHMATLTEAQQLTRENDLEDNFQFIGEKHDVENHMRASDALILCSKYEGLPNAICEGMASGLPIVASRVSDNEKLVQEGVNGFLCDPFDIESMAEAFKACLELSENDYKKLKVASRRKAEEIFDPKRYIDEYKGLYSSLLQ